MKVGELRRILKDLKADQADIHICSTDIQSLQEIADVGYVQERGCYVLWLSASELSDGEL